MSADDPDRSNAAPELAAIEFLSPGRFSVANPPAMQNPSDQWQPAPFVLGETAAIQRFESLDDARRHALALLGQAQRSLSLYSPNLEPLLYNHSSIQQACVRFLLAHPRNRLRVLLDDSSHAVKQGHRLLGLSRRLSSNMQIRKRHPEYPAKTCAVLVADDRGALVRPQPDQMIGYALYNDPGRVRQLQRQFDTAWDHSLSDPDLRSFLL
ncbi:hypothetical protein CH92_09145 [Stutzerimonas stutzeri]|uniref:DUF7931 domain-containing protein n=1 Tax=Stutzerimonas stutzeri TaxID=316 RepID=W8R6S0_STUST|nr:hypothetical protein [Stutzerimonas stutzeri]AHL75273.1 hypothetical protein CH92_09145 [Stutzerimonas stutzeri]MCQ4328179.1 histone acetyltransferase HPA2 [Stutzerimonas stutzeri]